MLMPSPQATIKLQNAQPLGLTTQANAPQWPRREWPQMELTDALLYSIGVFHVRIVTRSSHDLRVLTLSCPRPTYRFYSV